MQPSPTPQHLWLKNLLGRWTYESECEMGPGQPAMKARGEETVRALGDLWIVCESRGTMPDGGEMSAIMTLGYDPARTRFVGTWIGSPMPFMFVYEGILDEARGVLPLDTHGPSFADPTKTARYQDIIELHAPGTRVLRSQAQGDDGVWVPFMRATYTRAR